MKRGHARNWLTFDGGAVPFVISTPPDVPAIGTVLHPLTKLMLQAGKGFFPSEIWRPTKMSMDVVIGTRFQISRFAAINCALQRHRIIR
jgi:hypothetical protein